MKPAGGGSRCFRPVVWKRLWAPFHYALSVSSVKVVRHKNAEFFCGELWKKPTGGVRRLSGTRFLPPSGYPALETPGLFSEVLEVTHNFRLDADHEIAFPVPSFLNSGEHGIGCPDFALRRVLIPDASAAEAIR